MIKTTPIKYRQINGRWEAKKELGSFGDHLAYGDTKEEAEKKLRASLRAHAYSITHRAEGYFG